MVSGRVSHACQACARARVKCEEAKPCSRCRARSLVCRPPTLLLPRQHPAPLVSPFPSVYPGLQSPSLDVGSLPSVAGVTESAAFDNAYPAQYLISKGNLSSVAVASQAPMSFSSPGYCSSVVAIDDISLGSVSGANAGLVSTMNSTTESSSRHGEPSPTGYYQPHDPSGMSLGHAAASGFGIQSSISSPLGRIAGDDIVGMEQEPYAAHVEVTAYGDANFNDSIGAVPRMRHFWAGSMWQPELPINAHQGGSQEDLSDAWRLHNDHYNQMSTISEQQTSLPASVSSTGLTVETGHDFLERLTSAAHDNILAVILRASQTDPLEAMRVASDFPRVDVLCELIHAFLASHKQQACQWIDLGPSFRLNSQHPEWLISTAVAGAVFVADNSVQHFRRVFDGPIREAVFAIPARRINSSGLDLGLLQAMVLFQDIILWSSELPVIEITQGYLNIPINMIRSRGLFQHSMYPAVEVHFSESEVELERKRSKWVEQESWKRLVFHCYVRDAQVSIARQTPPQISMVELTLPLPESQSVWQARHLHEWMTRYMEDAAGRHGASRRRLPAVADLFRDISLLASFQHMLDVPFAVNIYLHGFWSIIWQLQQLNAVRLAGGGVGDLDKAYDNMNIFPTQSDSQTYQQASSPYPSYATCQGNTTAASNNNNSSTTTTATTTINVFTPPFKSQQQELIEQLQQLRVVLSGWYEISEQEDLILNLLHLNLHMLLYDLQLYSERAADAGLSTASADSRGDDERGYAGGGPRDRTGSRYDGVDERLQEWSSSVNGRQAAWHAGQILARFRQGIPTDHERTFHALALQQAALTMWAWGMAQQASAISVDRAGPRSSCSSSSTDESHYAYVFVDGAESLAVQQFIQFGQGDPVIRGGWVHEARASSARTCFSSGPAVRSVVRLKEPQACMSVVLSVLQATYAAGEEEIDKAVDMPPLVRGLFRRIEQLGAIASAVGLGRGRVVSKEKGTKSQGFPSALGE